MGSGQECYTWERIWTQYKDLVGNDRATLWPEVNMAKVPDAWKSAVKAAVSTTAVVATTTTTATPTADDDDDEETT